MSSHVILKEIKLKDTLFECYPKPVRISPHEFVIFINSRKQLIKYNTMMRKWTVIFDGSDLNAISAIHKAPYIVDWSLKTDFSGIKYVGYRLNNKILTVGLLKQNKTSNKVFIHFGDNNTNFKKNYLWMQPPNIDFCEPTSIPSDRNSIVAFDKLHNKYYILESEWSLLVIDVNKLQIELYKSSIMIPSNSSIVFANQQIHFIGYNTHAYDHHSLHIIFDVKQKHFSIKTKFYNICFAMCFYVETKGILIALNKKNTWIYTLHTNKWNELKLNNRNDGLIIRGGDKMYGFKTDDDKYILLYDDSYKQPFCYLDLITMNYKYCDDYIYSYISLRKSGYGIMMNTEYPLLVNGYIKKEYLSAMIPYDIINIITKFCAMVEIYFLNGKKHSKVNIQTLIAMFL